MPRLDLATVLDRVERGERRTVTRDGEPVAALVSQDEAAWLATLPACFRDRRPSFTQAALEVRTADALPRMDLSELMGPPADTRP